MITSYMNNCCQQPRTNILTSFPWQAYQRLGFQPLLWQSFVFAEIKKRIFNVMSKCFFNSLSKHALQFDASKLKSKSYGSALEHHRDVIDVNIS